MGDSGSWARMGQRGSGARMRGYGGILHSLIFFFLLCNYVVCLHLCFPYLVLDSLITRIFN